MEKRIHTKVSNYIDKFKSEVKTYIKTAANIPLTEKSDLLKSNWLSLQQLIQ